MKFREVTELVPGTKYKIVSNDNTYEGIYVSTNYLHRFKNVTGYELNSTNFVPHFHSYYEPIFQKERIQIDMEHRAVNKLLRNITGDPTFTWVGVYPYK
jgi:hypothetical protein